MYSYYCRFKSLSHLNNKNVRYGLDFRYLALAIVGNLLGNELRMESMKYLTLLNFIPVFISKSKSN